MKRMIAGTGIALASLLLAACGSGSSSGNSNNSTTLKGEPLVIGVQSLDQGPVAYPQSTYGAKAAEWYVNNKLGGVNGRPVKLDICSGDGNPDTGVKCANHFVTKNVPVLFDAYDGVSMQAMVPVLKEAGIPIVGELGGQGVAEAQPFPTAFYFSGPLETSALGMVKILHDVDKHNASLAVTDSASSHDYVDKLVAPMGSKLGLKVTAVYVKQGDLNFQVVASTEMSNKPDVAGVISLPEDKCTGLIDTLRKSGYNGTIFAGSCSQFITSLGKGAAGAIVQPRLWVPKSYDFAPPEVKKQLDGFAEAMKAVGYKEEQSARSLYSFAGLINLANILKDVQGEINSKSVMDALKNLKDFQSFAGPKVTCDGKQWPGRPGACSREGIFFEVQEDGRLKPVNPKGFIDLEPEAVS